MMPSSELRVSRLFSVKCHFRGNELAHGEEHSHNLVITGRQLVFTEMTLHGEESKSWLTQRRHMTSKRQLKFT